jgi:cytidine deaminase
MKTLTFDQLPDDVRQDFDQAQQELGKTFPDGYHLQVVAALRTPNGVYTGANIRRSSVVGSNCAERMVMDKALMVGDRQFTRLLVFAQDREVVRTAVVSPCGTCRQAYADTLKEFGQTDLEVVMISPDEKTAILTSMSELLPLGFDSESSVPPGGIEPSS